MLSLREQITAITNKAEAFHGFAERLMIGGKLIGHNDPDHQERVVKFNELLANCAIYSTAPNITDVGRCHDWLPSRVPPALIQPCRPSPYSGIVRRL